MIKTPSAIFLLLLSAPTLAGAKEPYRILRTVILGGEGGFDYITADSGGRRLYIARSGRVNPRVLAFDIDSLKPAGEIDGINAHGALIDPSTHHGFASSRPITMFDSQTMVAIKSIPVEGNPDGLSFDGDRIYVLSHSAPNITAIKPSDGTVVGTINLDAAVEETRDDGAGHLYVALEDKNAVGVIDTKSMTVTGRYLLGDKGGMPAGLAIDAEARLLFVTCRNPQVVLLMDADTGAIITTLPIGRQNDGAEFNPLTHEVFVPSGDGQLTVIKVSGRNLAVEQTLATPQGARTIALDAKTGHVFLMTADYGPTPADAPPPPAGRIARGPMLPGTFKIIEIGR